jgi:phosphomannomutase
MADLPSLTPLASKPIAFGTDGWRGVIAADFTFERVMRVAPLAARALEDRYGSETSSRTIIVGYDRRFLSAEFAATVAEVVQAAGYDVVLAEDYAPTPAFSWAAHEQKALGALVITASHNPAIYSGLKIKGPFGGSVSAEVTKVVETMLQAGGMSQTVSPGSFRTFDPWDNYCKALTQRVNVEAIRDAIASGQLAVFADVMHGAAAGGLEKLLGIEINELNGEYDPTFGGGAPEPLPRYLAELFRQIKEHHHGSGEGLAVGLVFDGDSDRVAAVDSQGNFLSTQVLIPVLIEHLVTHRGYHGEIVKTISGSDLIPHVAKLHNLPVHETAIGYKYIADRMLSNPVFLGGEESGGIGYGDHIPERDALMSALYTLEAVVQSKRDLSDLYADLQKRTGFTSFYDRVDLPLASMEMRSRLLEQLESQPIQEIANQAVTDCLTIDGYKFRLADQSWLLIRFSGTEPILRLYSEAATPERVRENLAWAKDWANAG